jgi:hypothetical protein
LYPFSPIGANGRATHRGRIFTRFAPAQLDDGEKIALSVGRLLFLIQLLRELLNAAQILTKEGRCGIFLSLVIHLMMIINK